MDFLDGWLEQQGLATIVKSETLEIFLIVLLTAIASFVSKRLFIGLERQFQKTKNLWDDTLLHAAVKPVSLVIWILGLSLAGISAQQHSNSQLFDLIDPIRKIGVIFCLTWFIVRFIAGAEKLLVNPSKLTEPMDETTVSAIGKLLRASVVITATLVVLQTLGYSISGVLAFGGIGGIAVGFAAKDLLANFFGGLMVYLDRPFKVGDWIRSADKEIEGTVEKIGWRLTTIRTFDKRPLYVPNSVFTSIAVQNPSRMSHRRIYETIGLRYDDSAQVETIVQRVKDMLVEHDGIDTSQTLIVNFNAFGPSSLDFFIYTFTKTTNWILYHEIKQDVLLRILTIISEVGAEIAYPTSTVHLPDAENILNSPIAQGEQAL